MPTLFALYIDEVLHYIDICGGLAACLAGIATQIMIYTDDSEVISDSLEGQRKLNAFKSFCTDRGLSVKHR